MEFINLKKQYEILKPMIDASVQDIMKDARFIGGKEVDELEKKLAEYVGRKHCISCANGTDALQLAYLAYGIKKNDAVFCPDMTFVASIEPAVMLGAHPVFVDIDINTYNIDANELEKKVIATIEEKQYTPRAVVMVDFLGIPANYDEISRVCKKYNLLLIEDAAQGIGGLYKGRHCGSLGDITCTSFFPSKPLGCYGDGGAVFTDDDNINALIRSYKVHGKGETKYNNVRVGMNSRLDTIQAAVLLAKLSIFEEEMMKRQEVARRYDEAFKDILQIPYTDKEDRCAYAQYVMLAKDEEQRERILNALKEENIPSILYYPKPMHKMEAFGNTIEFYPNATKYASCNFGVPFSPYITREEQDMVIQTIKKVLVEEK